MTYSGERFRRYFSDFQSRYDIQDMYSGGFYPFESLEEYWAWWSRQILVNRYEKAPKPVYGDLLEADKGQGLLCPDHQCGPPVPAGGLRQAAAVLHPGDYGLWQCSKPCHQETYDNEETVRKMFAEQRDMRIPTELVPRCPRCGRPMAMNLRCDDTFVQDAGWYAAARRYEDFLRRHRGRRLLFLELGVGGNTPGIIKYPFWKMTLENRSAAYACINQKESYIPRRFGGGLSASLRTSDIF